MAGKARRAAARQSQLNRRKKKGQRGPSGIPSTAPASNGQSLVNGSAEAAAIEGTVDDGVPVAAAPIRHAPSRRDATVARPGRTGAAPRIRGERPAAYNYVGAELRRIAVLSASVVAVLIVLGIVL